MHSPYQPRPASCPPEPRDLDRPELRGLWAAHAGRAACCWLPAEPSACEPSACSAAAPCVQSCCCSRWHRCGGGLEQPLKMAARSKGCCVLGSRSPAGAAAQCSLLTQPLWSACLPQSLTRSQQQAQRSPARLGLPRPTQPRSPPASARLWPSRPAATCPGWGSLAGAHLLQYPPPRRQAGAGPGSPVPAAARQEAAPPPRPRLPPPGRLMAAGSGAPWSRCGRRRRAGA